MDHDLERFHDIELHLGLIIDTHKLEHRLDGSYEECHRCRQENICIHNSDVASSQQIGCCCHANLLMNHIVLILVLDRINLHELRRTFDFLFHQHFFELLKRERDIIVNQYFQIDIPELLRIFVVLIGTNDRKEMLEVNTEAIQDLTGSHLRHLLLNFSSHDRTFLTDHSCSRLDKICEDGIQDEVTLSIQSAVPSQKVSSFLLNHFRDLPFLRVFCRTNGKLFVHSIIRKRPRDVILVDFHTVYLQ